MANEFQPNLTEDQVRQYAKDLKKYPQYYNEQQKEQLRAHAGYYNVPLYEGDFSILEAVKQAAGGFLAAHDVYHKAEAPLAQMEGMR